MKLEGYWNQNMGLETAPIIYGVLSLLRCQNFKCQKPDGGLDLEIQDQV